jgi:hypothetical protein
MRSHSAGDARDPLVALRSCDARRRNSESGRPGCPRGAIACRRNHRPLEGTVAGKLEFDGGRRRLPSRRSRASTDAAVRWHAVPRTDVIVFDQRLPRRLVERSPRRRELGRCRNSSPPAATRASTPVAAPLRERQPGAPASHRGSDCRQAHRRLPQLRQRRAAGVTDHNAGPSRAWRCAPLGKGRERGGLRADTRIGVAAVLQAAACHALTAVPSRHSCPVGGCSEVCGGT